MTPVLPERVAGFRLAALLRAAGIVGGVVIAAVVAFAVTAHVAGVSTSSVKPLAPPAAITPSPSPPSLQDIGRAALTRVVTVEADRTNEVALGTAWLLDTHGDFVTNAHVVEGQLTVRLTDRTAHTHPATVLGSDNTTDIAVVRSTDGFAGDPLPVRTAPVSGVPLPVVDVASSRATGHDDITTASLSRTGQAVPLQPGEVQAGANVPSVYLDMLAITGAMVYQGNSGGPVLDATGRVVGILTLASPSLPEAYAVPLSRVNGELTQFAARSG
ncbi:MAG: trypsin-like peptidase domain-containing protein [Candidatus Dormibacteria bacterium]